MNWIKIFSALSDETRLRIFLLLLKRDLCVCELVAILKMEQSRISHSLKELSNANLVSSRRKHRWKIYYINPEIEKTEVISAIKKEIKFYDQDMKNLGYCMKNSVRSKCEIKRRRNK